MKWNYQHSEHIPFYEKMSLAGRPTPLDDRPSLDVESAELWQVYCFTGGDGNILANVDIYASRIGLPADWEFEECLMLVADLAKKRHELEVDKRDRQHSKH
jgi:hypothetical protein